MLQGKATTDDSMLLIFMMSPSATVRQVPIRLLQVDLRTHRMQAQ
jgi:hypothetical protein